MKKISLGILISIFMGAATLSSYAQEKKVALTTFWVSKHIGFSALGGNAGLAASIASLAEDPSFNLQPVLDNFYKTFTEEYAKQFPFVLLPEEDVLDNADYKAYEGRFKESKDADRGKFSQRYLTPKTYKPLVISLFKGSKTNQTQMVNMFKDVADGVMFVSMGYDFEKKAVPFTAGVRAYIRITIWNKEGKKVLSILKTAMSKKTVAIVGGIPVMKPEKLLPLCESASEKLVADLSKKLGKIASKCAKKL